RFRRVLPDLPTREAFAAVVRETAIFLPGVRALAARHGATGAIERMPTGSMPVFAIGDDLVFKLFGPPHRAWFDAERHALAHVEGRLGVPTPRLVAAGEEAGYGYVLMSRVAGTPIEQVLPT